MGDLVKKKKMTLEDKIAERNKLVKEVELINENNVIDSFVQNHKTEKDKSFCLRINSKKYKQLQMATSKQGLSINACINLLIDNYLRMNS